MKRSRPKPVSDKRRAVTELRKEQMDFVFGPRESWKCQFKWHLAGFAINDFEFQCHGPVNGHEVVKRSQGGSITDMSNIVLLCNFHNGWVEDNPDKAHSMGLMRRSWERDED